MTAEALSTPSGAWPKDAESSSRGHAGCKEMRWDGSGEKDTQLMRD